MAGSIFRHTHRVVYAECTVGNHVYYSRYLDMLEEARGELLRQLGCSARQWQEAGTAFPVIGLEISYKGPGALRRFADNRIVGCGNGRSAG